MKKLFKIEMNINAVVYGNAIKHKAIYTTEFEIDSRFENMIGDQMWENNWKECAAIQAIVENHTDIEDQFSFVIGNDRKSVVESYASKILFAETSSLLITEI